MKFLSVLKSCIFITSIGLIKRSIASNKESTTPASTVASVAKPPSWTKVRQNEYIGGGENTNRESQEPQSTDDESQQRRKFGRKITLFPEKKTATTLSWDDNPNNRMTSFVTSTEFEAAFAEMLGYSVDFFKEMQITFSASATGLLNLNLQLHVLICTVHCTNHGMFSEAFDKKHAIMHALLFISETHLVAELQSNESLKITSLYKIIPPRPIHCAGLDVIFQIYQSKLAEKPSLGVLKNWLFNENPKIEHPLESMTEILKSKWSKGGDYGFNLLYDRNETFSCSEGTIRLVIMKTEDREYKQYKGDHKSFGVLYYVNSQLAVTSNVFTNVYVLPKDVADHNKFLKSIADEVRNKGSLD